jgi:hypothetical protein
METVTVDAAALRAVLSAFMGPSHHVLELWVTRNLPGSDVGKLVEQFNAAANTANTKPA